jgi:probable O-glycosylation ligase (exosortase A-associated)
MATGQPALAPEYTDHEHRASSSLSFWALMAFTFILLLAPQERFPVLAPLRIALLSAALAILTHVFSRLKADASILRKCPSLWYVSLLVGWALVTVPFSLWPGGSVAYLGDMYFKTVIVFLLLANVINTTSMLLRVTWGLVIICIPLAATTVGNFLSETFIPQGGRVAGYNAGLTSNPNDLALMLNLLLPLCIALFLNSRKIMTKAVLALITALTVAAIITTFSRTGFITLMVIGAAYLWQLRKRPQRAWIPVVVIAALCALPFIPADYSERISTIVNIEDDSSNSAQSRLTDMKVAAKLAAKSPVIGSGIGMNALALNEARGETWTEVHNVFLQLAVELGLPGMLLFLVLYVHCLKSTGATLRFAVIRDDQRTLFHIAEGLRVSLIGFGAAAMFHPVAYHFYFYYIAGLAIAADGIRQLQTASLPERAPLHAATGFRTTVR